MVKRAYTDVPDGQMHYRFEGNSGDAVILFHGAVSSSDEYERVIPYLSKKFRVFAPDYMGCGSSDKPPKTYDIIDHAKSMLAFMDSLGIKKASVGGIHGGATISAALAANWPDRIEKIILCCLVFFMDDNERVETMKSPNFRPVEIKPDGSHLLEWWRRAGRYGDAINFVEDRVVCMLQAGPRGEELHFAIQTYAAQMKDVLPRINTPTLILAPTRDHLAVQQPNVQKYIRGSKLVPIEGGHVYVARTMPKEFAAPILAFLENPGV